MDGIVCISPPRPPTISVVVVAVVVVEMFSFTSAAAQAPCLLPPAPATPETIPAVVHAALVRPAIQRLERCFTVVRRQKMAEVDLIVVGVGVVVGVGGVSSRGGESDGAPIASASTSVWSSLSTDEGAGIFVVPVTAQVATFNRRRVGVLPTTNDIIGEGDGTAGVVVTQVVVVAAVVVVVVFQAAKDWAVSNQHRMISVVALK